MHIEEIPIPSHATFAPLVGRHVAHARLAILRLRGRTVEPARNTHGAPIHLRVDATLADLAREASAPGTYRIVAIDARTNAPIVQQDHHITPTPHAPPTPSAPNFVASLLEEIRWLRRELRHQQDRADQNIRYERDRASRLALDADHARRRASALDCKVALKNIELVTLKARLEETLSRLEAQQAAHRRREAAPTSRRVEANRSSTPQHQPDRWLRPETPVSGLIGVCIGSRLAAGRHGAAADATKQPPDDAPANAEAPTDAAAAPRAAADHTAPPLASPAPRAADEHAAPPEAPGVTPELRVAGDHVAPPEAWGATPDPRAVEDNGSPPLNTIGATPGPRAADDHAAPPEAPDATPDPRAVGDNTSSPLHTIGATPDLYATPDLAAQPPETPGATLDPRANDEHVAPPEARGATSDPRAVGGNTAPPLNTIGATLDPRGAADHAAPLAAVAERPPVKGEQSKAPWETSLAATASRAIGLPPQPRGDDPMPSAPLPAAEERGAMSPSVPTIRSAPPDTDAPIASRRPAVPVRPLAAIHSHTPRAYRTRPGLLRVCGADREGIAPRRGLTSRKTRPRLFSASPIRRRSTPRTRRPPVRPPGR